MCKQLLLFAFFQCRESQAKTQAMSQALTQAKNFSIASGPWSKALSLLDLTTKNVSGDSKKMTETMFGDGTRGGNRRPRPFTGAAGGGDMAGCSAADMADYLGEGKW